MQAEATGLAALIDNLGQKARLSSRSVSEQTLSRPAAKFFSKDSQLSHSLPAPLREPVGLCMITELA